MKFFLSTFAVLVEREYNKIIEVRNEAAPYSTVNMLDAYYAFNLNGKKYKQHITGKHGQLFKTEADVMCILRNYPFSLADVLGVFRLYFETYEKYFDKPHPLIKPEQVQRIIKVMPFVLNHYGEVLELGADDYRLMVERHFETTYQDGCDFNICHFFSGDVRLLRFFEVCYKGD
jgi:mRNA-degrading endonuclease HigB of HigAB toxin-antitoxin module